MSRNARNEKGSENLPIFGDEKERVPVESGENGEHGDESGKQSPKP